MAVKMLNVSILLVISIVVVTLGSPKVTEIQSLALVSDQYVWYDIIIHSTCIRS